MKLDSATSARGGLIQWLLVLAVASTLGVLALLSNSAWAQTGGSTNEVWLLPIDTEINTGTTAFVRSRVQQANDELPLALVLYIDTPGGAVSAMQDIVGVILHETRVPTIAVVQNAFSAGALIAMSAQHLAMLPGSSIGAALPIMQTPTGVAPVDEKFSSALRGEFRSVAEARGRNARVAEGMVDERIEIPGLSTSTELITLTARQAVEHNIADTEAANVDAALAAFGYAGASITRLEPGLSERLAGLLSRPLVAALLLVVGIGGLLIELFSPGFGIPGAIGIIALGVFAAAAYFANPAGILDIGILVAGVVLLALEVFVLPGFGVAGILGLAAILIALIRIFEEGTLSVLGYGVLFGGVLLGVLLWMLPNSQLAAALRLSDRLSSGGGTAGTVPQIDRIELLGTTGSALTDLRPAGVARFGQDRVDVVSEGDFISVGSKLIVVRVEGSRVTVRKVDTQEDQSAGAASATSPDAVNPQTASTNTANEAGHDQTATDTGRKEA